MSAVEAAFAHEFYLQSVKARKCLLQVIVTGPSFLIDFFRTLFSLMAEQGLCLYNETPTSSGGFGNLKAMSSPSNRTMVG